MYTPRFFLVVFAVAACLTGCGTTEQDSAPSSSGQALTESAFEVISGGTGDQISPEIAHIGTIALVVWGETSGVRGARVDTQTGAVLDSNGIDIAAGTPTEIEVSASSSRFMVVWEHAGGVYARAVETNGTLVANSPTPVTLTGIEPSIGSNGSQFLVAWKNGTDIYATLLDANAFAVTNGGFGVSTDAAIEGLPAVGSDGSGFLVAWNAQEPGSSTIRGARVAATGVVLDSAAIELAAQAVRKPSIAHDGTSYVIAWSDSRTSADGYDIYARTVSNDAADLGSETVVTSAAGDQTEPQVDAWGSRLAFVWSGPASGAPAVFMATATSPALSGLTTQRLSTAAGAGAPDVDVLPTAAAPVWVQGGRVWAQLVGEEPTPPAQPGTIQFTSATFTTLEDAGQMGITVTRSGGTDGEAGVTYATTGGTATAGADFGSAGGSLTWSDGEGGPKTFVIPITNDDDVEGPETVGLTLTGATGAALGATTSATLTITDDDEPEPGSLAFEMTSHSVAEADGSITITVNRVGGSDGAVSVAFATEDGTAVATSDYRPQTGTLAWSDGDMAPKSFDVAILDDGDLEGSEAFSVRLSAPTGGATVESAAATIAIADDEAPSHGTIGVGVDMLAVSEGAPAQLLIRRTGGSDGAVTVSWTTRPVSASENTDYTGDSGTLTWADGDDADQSITVDTLGDEELEGDETFAIVLSGPTGEASLGQSKTVVTIQDAQRAMPGEIGFEENTYRVEEDEGVVSILVTRTGGDGEVTARYTTGNGSATNGDYTNVTGTIRFADGETEPKQIDIPLTADMDDEPNESFWVTLYSVTGGATLGTATATVLIVDDDGTDLPEPPDDDEPTGEPGVVSFTDLEVDVDETEGFVRLVVQRTEGTSGAISVDWGPMSVSARPDKDFVFANGTLEWADGEGGSKTIEVEIIDDEVEENAQTFQVLLGNPSGGVEIATGAATVTILDDDLQDRTPSDSEGCGGCSSSGGASPEVALIILGFWAFLQRRRWRERPTLA